MTTTLQLKRRKRRSDSSADALSSGGPSPIGVLIRGMHSASPGALYVLGVSMVIGFVAIYARL